MIAKLQGILDHTDNGFVIIMTGGVGYLVYTNENLVPGDTATLWIETIVREDSIRLFGFATIGAHALFNQLITVSGVGPRVAMAILATFKTDVLRVAIMTGDIKTICGAPGVGKKVAEKIILELRGKMTQIPLGDLSPNNNLSDLLSALETLGYRRVDIIEIAQKIVDENPNMGVEKLVPIALKKISRA